MMEFFVIILTVKNRSLFSQKGPCYMFNSSKYVSHTAEPLINIIFIDRSMSLPEEINRTLLHGVILKGEWGLM